MLKKLKNIRLVPMIAHLIITLAYPAARALRAESGRLLMFTNALTIVSLVLLIGGIIFSLALHGIFDISTYYIQRGLRSLRFSGLRRSLAQERDQSLDEYLAEAKDRRETAFNYPLFLGIVYLLLCVAIGYGLL